MTKPKPASNQMSNLSFPGAGMAPGATKRNLSMTYWECPKCHSLMTQAAKFCDKCRLPREAAYGMENQCQLQN
jgi:hypothetical protein